MKIHRQGPWSLWKHSYFIRSCGFTAIAGQYRMSSGLVYLYNSCVARNAAFESSWQSGRDSHSGRKKRSGVRKTVKDFLGLTNDSIRRRWGDDPPSHTRWLNATNLPSGSRSSEAPELQLIGLVIAWLINICETRHTRKELWLAKQLSRYIVIEEICSRKNCDQCSRNKLHCFQIRCRD